MPRLKIEWHRLFIEGAVIVVSILLAFAIDAWWDERQELEAAQYQVERVATELESNIERLEEQVELLDIAAETARDFLAHFSPSPEPLEKGYVSEVFRGLFASGTLSLNRSASENFLSSGQLTRGDWKTVRRELSELLSVQRSAEKASLELREMRPSILSHASNSIPLLDVTIGHPSMADYDASRFPYDPAALVSDMKFEGMVATFAIRIEINKFLHERLLEEHHALLETINEALDES